MAVAPPTVGSAGVPDGRFVDARAYAESPAGALRAAGRLTKPLPFALEKGIWLGNPLIGDVDGDPNGGVPPPALHAHSKKESETNAAIRQPRWERIPPLNRATDSSIREKPEDVPVPWLRAPRMKNIGFLGLGAMGEPMVESLLRAGFTVRAAAHRKREALDRLVSSGCIACVDPAEVARQSEAIIVCVPDAPQVEEVLFGPSGVAAGVKSGSIVIDMSTISPMASRGFSARLETLGVAFVDAPVSGGPARASAGTLTIMAGAGDSDFQRVRPLLEAMGTPHHVGPVGMGETVKLVNQIIIANVMVANAEALTFASVMGADRDAVRKVLAGATGNNYLLEQWLPKTWFAGTFEGGFAMDLLRKDVAAALDTARTMNLAMPASAFAYQLYTAQSAEGDGGRDYTAIAKLYERLAGHQNSTR